MSSVDRSLCVEILKEHFGPLVQKVGSCLISRGRCHLSLLAQSTKLPVKTIRECLFILIQHHLVTHAESHEGTRAIVYYEANIQEIMLRERFPLYIQTTAVHFDQTCAYVVQRTLELGYLYPPKLLESSTQSPSSLSQSIRTLIDGKYLIVCSAKGSITLKDQHLKEENEAIASAAAVTPLSTAEIAKVRKGLADQRLANSGMANGAGSKRKEVIDFEEAERAKRARTEEYNAETDIKYYRVNYERFHLLMRNEKLAEYATKRVNSAAGQIIAAMLNETSSQMLSCKHALSPPIRYDSIGALVRDQNLSVYGQKTNMFSEYMETLTSDPIRMLSNSDGNQYSVNLRAVTTMLKAQLIESIILEKAGQVSVRIWRLLHSRGKLDEKLIGKLAMANNKVARECLYTLFKSGFVFLQDVPKTMDHSASRTFFLWYVSIDRTCDILEKSAYQTIHRLKLRRSKELSDRAVLLEKTKRSDVLSGDARLTDSDTRKLAQLQSVLKKLYVSKWRIDEMVMLLRDF